TGMLRGHIGGVIGVAFRPNSQELASCGYDGVRVWNRTAAQESQLLHAGPNPIQVMALSPDGRSLAWGDRDRVQVCDASTGQQRHGMPCKNPTALAFSSNARLLAVAEGNLVRVREVESGREAFVLRGHANLIHSVAFSGNGKYLATASADQTARLWDAT